MADTNEPTRTLPRIGIRELRAGLASHVRHAGAGHRLVVTVDGVPTAQLGPIDAPAGLHSLATLIASGQVTAPRREDRPDAPVAMALPAGLTSEATLAELRGR